MSGFVYLLHLDRPYWHARHYTGWSPNPLQRLRDHAAGRGSPLLRAALADGIGWTVAAIWKGSRHMERRLKRWHCAGRFCPICRRESAMDQGKRPPPILPLWAPPPAVPAGPKRQPLEVTHSGVECVILSDRVEGFYSHFVGGRTRPCGKGRDEHGHPLLCWHEGCRAGTLEARWQGWLAVCPLGLPDRRLLCITPSVVVDCPRLTTSASLRGLSLRVWRTHAGAGAKMRGRLWTPDVVPTRLPAAFDVRRIVEKMLGAPTRNDARENILKNGVEMDDKDPLVEGL